MDTNDLILEELRALRTDYNDNARETGERLAKLEGSMYTLVGNGQPGRISLLESAVQKLQAWRWWLAGIAGGVSGVVSVVAWIVVEIRKA